MFSLRIVTADSYQSFPSRGFDVCYSDFRGCEIYKVPVIRIFGVTPSGQKGCLHVHGVFPYLSIKCSDIFPADEAKSNHWKCMQELALEIDRALNAAQRNSSLNRHHVYKIINLSKIPFYGYHDSKADFWRIYFYNPLDINRVADLLSSGLILGKFIQPYEAHIPYILQFFIDYNLFGMNLINTLNYKFRVSEDFVAISPMSLSTTLLDNTLTTCKIWNVNMLSSSQINSTIRRQTACELEVDCSAEDIANKLDVMSHSGKNPGLVAIWEEEKQRRRNEQDTSQITPVPSQERCDYFETGSELFYKNRLKKMLETYGAQNIFDFAINPTDIQAFPYASESPSQTSFHASFSNSQDNELLDMVLSLVNSESQSNNPEDDSILSICPQSDADNERFDDAETFEMTQVFADDDLTTQDWLPPQRDLASELASQVDLLQSQLQEQLIPNSQISIPQLDGVFDEKVSKTGSKSSEKKTSLEQKGQNHHTKVANAQKKEAKPISQASTSSLSQDKTSSNQGSSSSVTQESKEVIQSNKSPNRKPPLLHPMKGLTSACETFNISESKVRPCYVRLKRNTFPETVKLSSPTKSQSSEPLPTDSKLHKLKVQADVHCSISGEPSKVTAKKEAHVDKNLPINVEPDASLISSPCEDDVPLSSRKQCSSKNGKSLFKAKRTKNTIAFCNRNTKYVCPLEKSNASLTLKTISIDPGLKLDAKTENQIKSSTTNKKISMKHSNEHQQKDLKFSNVKNSVDNVLITNKKLSLKHSNEPQQKDLKLSNVKKPVENTSNTNIKLSLKLSNKHQQKDLKFSDVKKPVENSRNANKKLSLKQSNEHQQKDLKFSNVKKPVENTSNANIKLSLKLSNKHQQKDLKFSAVKKPVENSPNANKKLSLKQSNEHQQKDLKFSNVKKPVENANKKLSLKQSNEHQQKDLKISNVKKPIDNIPQDFRDYFKDIKIKQEIIPAECLSVEIPKLVVDEKQLQTHAISIKSTKHIPPLKSKPNSRTDNLPAVLNKNDQTNKHKNDMVNRLVIKRTDKKISGIQAHNVALSKEEKFPNVENFYACDKIIKQEIDDDYEEQLQGTSNQNLELLNKNNNKSLSTTTCPTALYGDVDLSKIGREIVQLKRLTETDLISWKCDNFLFPKQLKMCQLKISTLSSDCGDIPLTDEQKFGVKKLTRKHSIALEKTSVCTFKGKVNLADSLNQTENETVLCHSRKEQNKSKSPNSVKSTSPVSNRTKKSRRGSVVKHPTKRRLMSKNGQLKRNRHSKSSSDSAKSPVKIENSSELDVSSLLLQISSTNNQSKVLSFRKTNNSVSSVCSMAEEQALFSSFSNEKEMNRRHSSSSDVNSSNSQLILNAGKKSTYNKCRVTAPRSSVSRLPSTHCKRNLLLKARKKIKSGTIDLNDDDDFKVQFKSKISPGKRIKRRNSFYKSKSKKQLKRLGDFRKGLQFNEKSKNALTAESTTTVNVGKNNCNAPSNCKSFIKKEEIDPYEFRESDRSVESPSKSESKSSSLKMRFKMKSITTRNNERHFYVIDKISLHSDEEMQSDQQSNEKQTENVLRIPKIEPIDTEADKNEEYASEQISFTSLKFHKNKKSCLEKISGASKSPVHVFCNANNKTLTTVGIIENKKDLIHQKELSTTCLSDERKSVKNVKETDPFRDDKNIGKSSLGIHNSSIGKITKQTSKRKRKKINAPSRKKSNKEATSITSSISNDGAYQYISDGDFNANSVFPKVYSKSTLKSNLRLKIQCSAETSSTKNNSTKSTSEVIKSYSVSNEQILRSCALTPRVKQRRKPKTPQKIIIDQETAALNDSISSDESEYSKSSLKDKTLQASLSCVSNSKSEKLLLEKHLTFGINKSSVIEKDSRSSLCKDEHNKNEVIAKPMKSERGRKTKMPQKRISEIEAAALYDSISNDAEPLCKDSVQAITVLKKAQAPSNPSKQSQKLSLGGHLSLRTKIFNTNPSSEHETKISADSPITNNQVWRSDISHSEIDDHKVSKSKATGGIKLKFSRTETVAPKNLPSHFKSSGMKKSNKNADIKMSYSRSRREKLKSSFKKSESCHPLKRTIISRRRSLRSKLLSKHDSSSIDCITIESDDSSDKCTIIDELPGGNLSDEVKVLENDSCEDPPMSSNEVENNVTDSLEESFKVVDEVPNITCDTPELLKVCRPCSIKICKLSSSDVEKYTTSCTISVDPQNQNVENQSSFSSHSPINFNEILFSNSPQNNNECDEDIIKELDSIFLYPSACGSPLKSKSEASPFPNLNCEVNTDFSFTADSVLNKESSNNSKTTVIKCNNRLNTFFTPFNREDVDVLWNLSYFSPNEDNCIPSSPPSCFSPLPYARVSDDTKESPRQNLSRSFAPFKNEIKMDVVEKAFSRAKPCDHFQNHKKVVSSREDILCSDDSSSSLIGDVDNKLCFPNQIKICSPNFRTENEISVRPTENEISDKLMKSKLIVPENQIVSNSPRSELIAPEDHLAIKSTESELLAFQNQISGSPIERELVAAEREIFATPENDVSVLPDANKLIVSGNDIFVPPTSSKLIISENGPPTASELVASQNGSFNFGLDEKPQVDVRILDLQECLVESDSEMNPLLDIDPFSDSIDNPCDKKDFASLYENTIENCMQSSDSKFYGSFFDCASDAFMDDTEELAFNSVDPVMPTMHKYDSDAPNIPGIADFMMITKQREPHESNKWFANDQLAFPESDQEMNAAKTENELPSDNFIFPVTQEPSKPVEICNERVPSPLKEDNIDIHFSQSSEFLVSEGLLQSRSVTSTSQPDSKDKNLDLASAAANGEDILSMIVRSCNIYEEFDESFNSMADGCVETDSDKPDNILVPYDDSQTGAFSFSAACLIDTTDVTNAVSTFGGNNLNSVIGTYHTGNGYGSFHDGEKLDTLKTGTDQSGGQTLSENGTDFKCTQDIHESFLLDSVVHSFYGEDTMYGINSSMNANSSWCSDFQNQEEPTADAQGHTENGDLPGGSNSTAPVDTEENSHNEETQADANSPADAENDQDSRSLQQSYAEINFRIFFANTNSIVIGPTTKPPSRSEVKLWLAHKVISKESTNDNVSDCLDISTLVFCDSPHDSHSDVSNEQESQSFINALLSPNAPALLCTSRNHQKNVIVSKMQPAFELSPVCASPNYLSVESGSGNCRISTPIASCTQSVKRKLHTKHFHNVASNISPLNQSDTEGKVPEESVLSPNLVENPPTVHRKRKLSYENRVDETEVASKKHKLKDHLEKLNLFQKGKLALPDSLEYSTHSGSSSQLDGPTFDNSMNFKVNDGSIGGARISYEAQHLTVMSLEVHVGTRNELRPDPKFDAVETIFFSIYNDSEDGESKEEIVGIVSVNCRQVENGAERSSRELQNYMMSIPGIKKAAGFCVENEKMLFEKLTSLVKEWDPDIFIGYEIQMSSWGYLIERAAFLGIDLNHSLSRLIDQNENRKPVVTTEDHTVTDQTAELNKINITGRIVLNVWRLMRKEVTLNVYTFENVYYHVLHKRTPLHTYQELTKLYGSLEKEKVIRYYVLRARGSMQLLVKLDVIRRTSELARLFGIQFYDVLSRGSQFRVESMMLRNAIPLNYIPVSPSVRQRSHSRAPECIPLVLEPESRFYTDPVLVLDFQSLYPSMIIAYNYCYSTCLGRVDNLGKNIPFEFGCTSLTVPVHSLHKLNSDIHVSPSGVAFVKSSVRRGILPMMLEEILNTRIMVKQSLKKVNGNPALKKLLDARQLGLKLIANVTYGYTGASFSGRMPNVEVADSIVGKARETLERAISMVENTPKWNARVVYGDTDSMFVLLPGRSKEQAFKIGEEIADAVTAVNPTPVKLKFEKVYLPCVLQTKKRYVGFMYETSNQKKPVFDAKGIETVRRDSCPATAKILEKSLKILFGTYSVSAVKKYVQKQFTTLLQGRLNVVDCIFAKEYRGISGYRASACVPALEIAKKRLVKDPRSEPRAGERVPYVIVYGFPGLPIIQLVREPLELMHDQSLRINAKYYITRVISPPLERVFSLIGADVKSWYSSLARTFTPTLPMVRPTNQCRGTLSQYFSTLSCPACDKPTNKKICSSCQNDPQATAVVLHEKIRHWERTWDHLRQICNSCAKNSGCAESCCSVDCPVLFRLNQATKDISQVPYVQSLTSQELF